MQIYHSRVELPPKGLLWIKVAMDDSLRRGGVDGDAGIGDVVPSGTIEDMHAREKGGPDVMLEGDGSPLVDLTEDCGPTEPIDSNLRSSSWSLTGRPPTSYVRLSTTKYVCWCMVQDW